jgi:hypothetical protein
LTVNVVRRTLSVSQAWFRRRIRAYDVEWDAHQLRGTKIVVLLITVGVRSVMEVPALGKESRLESL